MINNGFAGLSLACGIVCFIGLLYPDIGLYAGIGGVLCGVVGMNSNSKGIAIAGLVLASIGIVLTLLMSYFTKGGITF